MGLQKDETVILGLISMAGFHEGLEFSNAEECPKETLSLQASTTRRYREDEGQGWVQWTIQGIIV